MKNMLSVATAMSLWLVMIVPAQAANGNVAAGQAKAGPDTDTPTQVSSCGSTDLRGLVMFVVDATRPFSSPASFP